MCLVCTHTQKNISKQLLLIKHEQRTHLGKQTELVIINSQPSVDSC